MKDFKIEAFQTVLTDELIPYIDANFRTTRQRVKPCYGRPINGRYGNALRSRLHKPGVFSQYALLSGGIYTPEEVKGQSKT